MESTSPPPKLLEEAVKEEAEKSETPLGESSTSSPSIAGTDPDLVDFAEDDAEYPKNWSSGRKLTVTVLVSAIGFITPATSSMIAPALDEIAKDLHINKPIESQLILSIFILGMGIGPLLIGPLSEMYGRAPVLRLGNLFYLVFNTAAGFARNKSEMLAFRFLGGFGGSAPLVVGSGIISDCYRAEERGVAVAIYNIFPLLGPSTGPIAGAFITQSMSWRWVFYFVSIADLVLQFLAAVFLRETYPPILLDKRRRQLAKSTGNTRLRTPFDRDGREGFSALLRRNLLRALRLLATQPIVQVLAIYLAYVYGLMYLTYSTFPTLWTGRYHESTGIGSLNYVSLGLGYLAGSFLCGMLVDRIYTRLKRRNGGKGEPEFRVPMLALASLLVPTGLFWYGWSAQARLHWIMPNIGSFIFSAGVIMIMQSVNNYIVDCYPLYAASAIAAVTLIRNLPGTGFPLFAPYMYDKLGYGWGSTVLALVAVCIGIPSPLLIWQFGKRMRVSSRMASSS
ncbi:MAG: hypothetical protein M1819_000492 [Sarea resinae]|nr:MAG: hypothetical protein M1819_000492 [Sarea resinae]